jgi:hypothetical protein
VLLWFVEVTGAFAGAALVELVPVYDKSGNSFCQTGRYCVRKWKKSGQPRNKRRGPATLYALHNFFCNRARMEDWRRGLNDEAGVIPLIPIKRSID